MRAGHNTSHHIASHNIASPGSASCLTGLHVDREGGASLALGGRGGHVDGGEQQKSPHVLVQGALGATAQGGSAATATATDPAAATIAVAAAVTCYYLCGCRRLLHSAGKEFLHHSPNFIHPPSDGGKLWQGLLTKSLEVRRIGRPFTRINKQPIVFLVAVVLLA